MSCNEEIHLGDIGTAFNITIEECINTVLTAVDLTGASSIEVYFGKPTLPAVQKVGTVIDAAAGIVQYITIADDLDELGTWKVQAKAIFPQGEWKSSITDFKVHKNII